MKNFINSVIILSVVGFLVKNLYEYEYSKNYDAEKFVEQLSVKEQYRLLDCLTENIYYETAGEKLEGKISIAQVTISRVMDKKFDKDICRVVHAKSQFSWTMNKPKALIKIDKAVYDNSRFVAKKVLFENERVDCVANSLYYHNKNMTPKGWDFSKLKKTCVIGNHVFYKDA